MTAQTISRRGRAGASVLMAGFAWIVIRSASPGANFQIQTSSAPPAVQQPPRNVDVRVDSGTLHPEPAGSLATVCSLSEPEQGRTAPWQDWVGLKGVRIAAMPGPDQIPIYAERLPDGAAVCIANHSAARIVLNIKVFLPPGSYSIERLGFACEPTGPTPATERMTGRVLSTWEPIKKPGWLAPGAASIYRFTNHSARTNLMYQKVRGDLAVLRASSAQAYRRIMYPLGECWDHLGPVTSGNPRHKEACLKHIHRALLTLAHAQSLARNFIGEGLASRKTAGALSTDLDGLQRSLTELSMACLGLVPGAAVSSPDSADPMVRKITVSVANQGNLSVSFVRLGAAAPAGCRVWPQEEAMFDSLRPGETVRASFSVRLADESSSRGIMANIGYFTQRSPAHLSLQVF